MIRYDLTCDQEHTFEGWFSDSAAFDAQAERGELGCPVCDSTAITKALMAPRVGTKGNRKDGQQAAMAAQGQVQVRKFLQSVRSHVEQNSEHVGEKFPEEARKIHYGEKDQRNIYGDATVEEVKDLRDEGIEVAAVPWPDRDN